MNPISLYEDEIYGEKEVPEPTLSVVVFSLNDEWYGIDIMHVEKVVPASSITLLPNTPEHILGIFNLRGNIISITDLKKIFGLPADVDGHGSRVTSHGKSSIHDRQRIVVVQSKGMATGLLVDGSADSHEIPLSEIQPPVATLGQEEGEIIEGQFKLNERLIALLNAENLIEKTRWAK
jgi:purine-binding chemotaxis protein CheW